MPPNHQSRWHQHLWWMAYGRSFGSLGYVGDMVHVDAISGVRGRERMAGMRQEQNAAAFQPGSRPGA